MSDSVLIPNQINYKKTIEYAPKYRFMRIPLNNISGNSITVTPTASQLLEFKLPPSVYNLSKSILAYELSNPGLVGAFKRSFEEINKSNTQRKFLKPISTKPVFL